jgi:hypothetical protein
VIGTERGTELNFYRRHHPARVRLAWQLSGDESGIQDEKVGGSAIAGSPADFSKLIAEETEKWGKVVEALRRQARLPKK